MNKWSCEIVLVVVVFSDAKKKIQEVRRSDSKYDLNKDVSGKQYNYRDLALTIRTCLHHQDAFSRTLRRTLKVVVKARMISTKFWEGEKSCSQKITRTVNRNIPIYKDALSTC